MDSLHGYFGPQRWGLRHCDNEGSIATGPEVDELPEAGASEFVAVALAVAFKSRIPPRLIPLCDDQQVVGVELKSPRKLALDLPAAVQKLKENWRELAAARVASFRKHVPKAAEIFLHESSEADEGAVMGVKEELRDGSEL